MAYPFVPLRPYKDVVARLAEKGIELRTSQTKELDNGHRTVDVQFFCKPSGNGTPDTLVPAPPLNEEDLVTHDVMHSLCRRLDLDPKLLGYDLGFVEYDDEDE